jgi:DNA polymerase III delta prime subunit
MDQTECSTKNGEKMSFHFRPAVREKTSLLIALAGPSGCGKTYSALRLASGLAGEGGKIAVIDTEAGRALHYADKFKFDHGDFKPPFSPDAYVQAIQAADQAGYGAIVIDSMSHEYEGEGGVLEWAAELEGKGVKSPGNWKLPKTAHKRMMNKLLQCRAHLIFCLRAEEKIKLEKIDGKMAVIPMGWMPICEKRFMFEMTCSFLMLDSVPGVGQPIKLQDQHKVAFPQGKQIGEESGKALAAWAHGAPAPAAKVSDNPPAQQPANESTVDQFWARTSYAMRVPQKTDQSGLDWLTWSSKFIRAIAVSPDLKALDKLLGDNQQAIDTLDKEDWKLAEKVSAAIDGRRG